MGKKSLRRTDYGVVLLVCSAILIGLLTGSTVYQAKKHTHLNATIGEAETLLELTNSFVSTYAMNAQYNDLVDPLVPAAFRAAAARHFNEIDARSGRPIAVMVGLKGREIETPPIDDALADRLSNMASTNQLDRYSSESKYGGDLILRTVFPTIASQDSCVNCHNQIQVGKPLWKKGDLMGAYVVDRPISTQRKGIWVFSVLVGLLAGVASLLAGGLYAYSKRLHAQSLSLRILAETDPLTGCLNRRALSDAFEATDFLECGGAIFVLDLDHFKNINDRIGHDAGDQVLTHFTEMVRAQLRDNDLLARIGGEEFAVILPNTSAADALQIAQRTCVAVSESHVQFGEVTIRYTVSIGTAFIRKNSNEPLGTWLSVADNFLYRAKALGRNQVFPKAI